MRPHLFALTLLAVIAPVAVAAQPPAPPTPPLSQPTKGPIIPDFGPAYVVPNPGLPTPMLQELKVRFDVADTPADVKAVSAQLETAARFLNMHAKAGVSAERLKVAVVVHGEAGKDVLSNEAYRKRHGIDNPNLPLLEALRRAGARLYLCGQTAAAHGIAASEVAAPVQLALSAMTAHLVLNAEGYVLNPF